MKKLSGIIAVLLFSVQGWASVLALSNAQMRACRISGGYFFVAETEDDQIGLCKIGPSIVGSIDILNKNARIEIPLSLHNYRKGVRRCIDQNLTTLYTPDNGAIDICRYSDGSFIDLETLAAGKDHMRNAKLNRALGL